MSDISYVHHKEENTWSTIQEVGSLYIVQQVLGHLRKVYHVVPECFIVEVAINSAPR
jgi:hypothetical protein